MKENDFMLGQIQTQFRTKAMYYPNVVLTTVVMLSGSRKLLEPQNPYEKPLPNGKRLIRVDLLESVKNMWGESVLLSRDNVYKLVSGDTDKDTYYKLLRVYYCTHAAFTNYIRFIHMFDEGKEPFVVMFWRPVRQCINTYTKSVEEMLYKYKGTRFLLEDREYRYYTIPEDCDVSGIKNIKEMR